MKFKINRSELLEGLQAVQNVVGIRSTLPILANVLLTAEKDKVWLTTTDLDVSVRSSVPASVTKSGSSTLPAKRLAGIIRELADNEIDVEINDKDVATVKCGPSFFKIIGLSQDEFPPIPKPDGKIAYRLQQSMFRRMLKLSSYAVSTDETRFVLNGVLLSLKDEKLAVVATDGRRLALVEQEVEFPKEGERDMILPTKAVNELLHTLEEEGEIVIHATENQIMFEFGAVLIASKLIDGTYPNYRQVIPSQSEEHVTVERETLMGALRRVSLLMTDKSHATRMTFSKNNLEIAMNAPDVGEARETIPIKYTGQEISVAFNPEYMLDPLRNLSTDEVTIEFTDELSPGVIKCDTPFVYVLMPMRIS